MSEYKIQGSTLTEIADAIREKAGVSMQFTPQQMAEAIRNYQGGGDSFYPFQASTVGKVVEYEQSSAVTSFTPLAWVTIAEGSLG